MNFVMKLCGYLYYRIWSAGLWSPNDRKVLLQEVFPFLKARYQKILFVGVQKYTSSYEKYFLKDQIESIDIDPEQERWGFKRHFTGTLEQLKESSAERYDAVVMNGVIGYGLNEMDDAEKALKVAYELLSEHGLLVLGINPHHKGNFDLEKSQSLLLYYNETNGIRNSHCVTVQNEVFKDILHNYSFYSKKPGSKP